MYFSEHALSFNSYDNNYSVLKETEKGERVYTSDEVYEVSIECSFSTKNADGVYYDKNVRLCEIG